MIEPFCSVYTKSYRPFNREPDIFHSDSCVYFDEPPEQFLPAEDLKAAYNKERDEAIIKALYLKRMVSTYQHSYCRPVKKKTSSAYDPNNLEEDQFMTHFNKYYSKKTDPVLRPLATARIVHGYSRFCDYYTGKSIYETTISREGYNYFKRDYDKGISRLHAKKQQALLQMNREEVKEEKTEEPDIKSQTVEPCTVEKICELCHDSYNYSPKDSPPEFKCVNYCPKNPPPEFKCVNYCPKNPPPECTCVAS